MKTEKTTDTTSPEPGTLSAGKRKINRFVLEKTLTSLRDNPQLPPNVIPSIDKWLAENARCIRSASEDDLEKLVTSLQPIIRKIRAQEAPLSQATPAIDATAHLAPENPLASHSASPEPTHEAPTYNQSEAARLHAAGIKLVPLHHLRKRPIGDAWNKPEQFVRKVDLTTSGYGIPLKANGLCSIDADQVDLAAIAFRAVGFDLDKIMNQGVRTTSTRPGSGGRAAFKAQDSLTWVTFSVRMVGQKESTVVFELRAGSSNLQDCCPGVAYQTVKLVNGVEVVSDTIYAQEYANNGETTFDKAPQLPVGFDDFWEKMSVDPAFRRDAEQKMVAALVAAGHPVEPVFNLRFAGKKLAIEIDARLRAKFNAAVTVESILTRHGYLAPKRKGGRWMSPGASGAPSVRLIPGHDSLWQSDHQSDPLNGTFDAAQASAVLDHNYDVEAFEAWVRERQQGLRQREAMVDFAKELGQAANDIEYADIPANPGQEKLSMEDGSSFITWGNLVQMIRVEWFWKNRLAIGMFHLLGGTPGTGKSTIAFTWAATISAGGEFADGARAPKGKVLIWSGEDSYEATIKPRLVAAGADMTNIGFLNQPRALKDGNKVDFNPANHLPALMAEIETMSKGEVVMLIIDPIVTVIGDKDNNSTSEVRSALAPLVAMLDKLGIIGLGIMHFTKGSETKDPKDRFNGSSGYIALARVGFAVVKDQNKDGRHLLTVAKSNIGPEGGGYNYHIERAEVTDPNVGVIETSKVVWGDTLEGDARQLIREAEVIQRDRPANKQQRATALLREMLSAGPCLVHDIEAAATNEGIGWRTVEAAKNKIGAVSERSDPDNNRSLYQWRIPVVDFDNVADAVNS